MTESRRFASDVSARLAKIDHDVSVLRAKYGHLMNGQVKSNDGARAAVSDLNRFFVASLQDVQIDVLQLLLAVQEDPDVVEFRLSRLREKLQGCAERFRQVRDDDRIGAYHRELKEQLGKSKLGIPPLRRWLGEKSARMRRVRKIRRDFEAAQTRAAQWIDATDAVTDESRRPSLIFYREPDGERALRARHTHDIRLERVA